MTRSNLYITLSDGTQIDCVADSSSAPEQGYFVESVLFPLIAMDDAEKEMALITEHCTLNELRTNASYRYHINLKTKEVSFHEEVYNHRFDTFKKGRNLTERLTAYYDKMNARNLNHLRKINNPS